MLRKMAVVVLVLVPALAWAAIVPTPPNTTHAGEQSLWEIVNTVYSTSFTSNSDLNFAQVATEVYSGGFTATATAVFTANTQTFGWYEDVLPGAIGSMNTLFTVTGSGYGATGSGSFFASGDFGLFLTTGPHGGNNTWFSETARNSDGEDHQALYDLALLTGNTAYAGSYLSAWEDLPMGRSGVSDYDFNDLVLQLDTNIIPEPTTMTLLGLGLAGLAARRWRKTRS